jgi:hypothetical protein
MFMALLLRESFAARLVPAALLVYGRVPARARPAILKSSRAELQETPPTPFLALSRGIMYNMGQDWTEVRGLRTERKRSVLDGQD